MSKKELLKLDPFHVTRLLSAEEVVHMAVTLDAYWAYDYEAAKQGRVGMHAKLKSERHSDGFFISRILLQYPNIRKIMAGQMAARIMDHLYPKIKPSRAAGVPDGATELGKDLANLLGVQTVDIQKIDGKITLLSNLNPNETLLLCEDFCTRGTGFKEAVRDIVSKQPHVRFIFHEPVIINRGGLKTIDIEGTGSFKIMAIAEHRVNDWAPDECPLCKTGSKPIKPKATDENWIAISTSQLS